MVKPNTFTGLEFSGKIFSLSPLSMMLTVDFSKGTFYEIVEVPFCS